MILSHVFNTWFYHVLNWNRITCNKNVCYYHMKLTYSKNICLFSTGGRFTLARAYHFCLSLPPMFAREAGARPCWSDTAAHALSLRDRACVDMPASTHYLTRTDSEKCVHFPLPVYTTENSCTNTLGRHKQYTVIWDSTIFRQFISSILLSELLLLYTLFLRF